MDMNKKHNLFKTGEVFPPQSHYERIKRYRVNKKLFEGHHCDVFKKNMSIEGRAKELLYISVNLAGTICKKSADFLFGEDLKVLAGNGSHTKEQEALDRFYEENHLNIMLYESALSNAYKGDAFIKVRYGQEYAGELPPELDEPRVIIETINPEFVYPEAMEWDRNKIKCYHIAIPYYSESADEWILKVESHYAGKIIYCDYNITPLYFNSDNEVERFTINGAVEGTAVAVATGVNVPLIVHIPNTGSVEGWEGKDDLTEHHALLDEINNRLSQISDILDKHANPALAVPAGLLAEDEYGNAQFRVATDKVFEVMGKEDIVPQYITWSSNLNEAFQELDRLIELLLMSAEVPPVVLGKETGTSGTGSMAIKWQMNSLLAKVNRKRQYYAKGIKQALYIAQKLEEALGIADYNITVPNLHFQDGLPKDDMEQANIMSIRTNGAKTMSQKTAIMLLNNMTEEQAEQEIERINEEAEAETVTATPDLFNEPAGANPFETDNETEEL